MVYGTSKRKHGPDSVQEIACRDVPVMAVDSSVADVRQLLAAREFACADLIIAIDANGDYFGVVEAARILAAANETRLRTLARTDWPVAAPGLDQEHAADMAAAAGVSVLPVVDGKKPVGIVPATTLLHVLASEHHEDISRFVGMLKATKGARAALEDGVLRRVSQRLPWLLVGLVLSSAATGVMSYFESVLEANVMVALFIPALVYIADAVGTQTEAIAVRGLTLRHKPLAFILIREALTGALIGASLGAVAVILVWYVFGDVRAAWGVGISLVAAGTTASVIGLLLPWLLSRAKIDPAFGSGPVATIIQDVLTILVYFHVMTIALGL